MSQAPPSVSGSSEATDSTDATTIMMSIMSREVALGRSTTGAVGNHSGYNPNRDASSGWRRSRSNDRGDDHSRDRERNRQQIEDAKAKRALSKSPNHRLDQGDDGKRREHSRSRSRERRPASSERAVSDEDKEKEQRHVNSESDRSL